MQPICTSMLAKFYSCKLDSIKWDDISMDFIVGLPLMAHKFNSIWVIVDQLSKSAHFIPVNTHYDARRYVKIYIAHVLCLHGVLKMIISDRGSQFVTRF
jgi:hypothetical protein